MCSVQIKAFGNHLPSVQITCPVSKSKHLEMIKLCCVVTDADPDASYADGPGLSAVGATSSNKEERTFVVHAIDSDNNPVLDSECKAIISFFLLLCFRSNAIYLLRVCSLYR